MGLPTVRASLLAMALGVAIWLLMVAISPAPAKAWLVILELFTALAFAYELPSLVNRKHWPAQPIFLWSRSESERLYPEETGADEDRISRVDELVSAGTGEPGTWNEVRTLALGLEPAARRQHILAMADLFETGEFDASAFDGALLELPHDAKRYWRIRLAMTRAFASYDEGGDYLPLLLDAAGEEGPFELTRASWSRLYTTRYLVGVFFLAIGVVLALLMAIAGGV
jgi:hypothetical protein